MAKLPATAAWRHLDAREGFEVLFIAAEGDGYRFEGYSAAVEEGETWCVRYSLAVDSNWGSREAHVAGRSARGGHEVRLRLEDGEWLLDGRPVPELAGCDDVDLEASAFTNAFPVRRLGLAVGEGAEAPAAYVRMPHLRVQRLEQRYARLEDEDGRERYEYAAPEFEFECVLSYDEDGLVVEYPGIAVRAA